MSALPAQKPSAAFLLAVWGEKYIQQFMELSLRTLLAPGNIPAMAAQYDCRFVLLTQEEDRPIFEKHPLFARLSQYCRVEFIEISDLIFGGNYSATITLAYERGMRSAGPRFCDTYFVYLVSDYVMADGSLRGLMRYLERGYRGVTAGNFQIVEERCHEEITAMADPATGLIALTPRQLMRYALPHLHPMTLANTINQDLCHSVHSNRLFWQVDDDTLIGRFYLRHMLCIRPETEDCVIGASCDYSFIPEFCPSGNVAHIDDSDDYCVVELQPMAHEQRFIRLGPADPHALATSLSEWTTADHRRNAHIPVVFHAKDCPPGTVDFVEKSECYIRSIESKLGPAVSVRNHPYWTSCIRGLIDLLLEQPDQQRYCRNAVFAGIFGSPVFGKAFSDDTSDYALIGIAPHHMSMRRRLWRLLSAISGHPPHVRPWHRRWGNYRAMLDATNQSLRQHSACLFISSLRTPLANWLRERNDIDVDFQKLELFLQRRMRQVKPSSKDTHLIIAYLTSAQLASVISLVKHSATLLPQGGRLCLLVNNMRVSKAEFQNRMATALTACAGSRFQNVQRRLVTAPLNPALDARFYASLHRMSGCTIFQPRMAVEMVRLGLLGLMYFASNLLGLADRDGRKFHATGAIIILDVKPVAQAEGAPMQKAA